MRKQLGSLLMAVLAFGWVLWGEIHQGANPRASWSFADTFETKLACERRREIILSLWESDMSKGDNPSWHKEGNNMLYFRNKEFHTSFTYHCVPDHIDPRPRE